MNRIALTMLTLILFALPALSLTPSVTEEKNEETARLMKAAIETFEDKLQKGITFDAENYVSIRYTNNKRVLFAMVKSFDFPKSGSAHEIWEDDEIDGLLDVLKYEKLTIGVIRTEYELSDIPTYHIPAGDYLMKVYVDDLDDVMYVGFYDEKGRERDRVQTNFEVFDKFKEPKKEMNDVAKFHFSRFEPGLVNNFYGAIRIPFVLDEDDFNRYFLLKLRFRQRHVT